MMFSETLIKQDRFIIGKILQQMDRTEDLEKITFLLGDFEGKPFHELPISELLRHVSGVFIKLKKEGFINNFQILQTERLSLELPVVINAKNKTTILKKRWNDLNNIINEPKNKGLHAFTNISRKSTYHPSLKKNIPRNKMTITLRNIASIIDRNPLNKEIDNFLFAQCIKNNIKEEEYKGEYKKMIDVKIKNCFKILRKKYMPNGYQLKYRINHSELSKRDTFVI